MTVFHGATMQNLTKPNVKKCSNRYTKRNSHFDGNYIPLLL